MRTIILSLILLFVNLGLFGQSGPDVAIVKPLINYNTPDGGYYRGFVSMDLNSLYCGAEVQNIGDSIAYNTYLEVTIYNDYAGYEETFYSDTIPMTNPGQTRVIQVEKVEFGFNPYYELEVSIHVVCDSSDVDLENNIVSIPPTILGDLWANVLRTDNATGSIEEYQEVVFQSGDFIGFTLSLVNIPIDSYELFFTANWPENLELTIKMFKDQSEVYSREFTRPSGGVSNWYGLGWGCNFGDIWVEGGHNYYIGVEMNFPEGTEIPIGIDTSWHHNFEAESIARINGQWVSLPYVPVMWLVCNPEGISETDDTQLVNIYPNPATDQITIDDVQQATIFDATGRKIASKKTMGINIQFDVSDYIPGVYFVKAKSNGEKVIGRFVKQ